MSLLLKGAWRNMLKSGTFHGSLVCSRSHIASLSAIDNAHVSSPSDTLMLSIKSAPSYSEVLNTVQRHLPTLNHQHLLQALKTLNKLRPHSNEDNSELLQDPAFGVLCQNFNKHARALDVNEAIDALKALSFLKVPFGSLIVQTILQIIRCNINNLNLRQIMFVDFLIRQNNDGKNHLADALKLALPLAFQIHLPFEIDKEDLPLLKEMLSFSCSHDLPDRCINNVITALLLQDQAIDPQTARSIIWSLAEINCTDPKYPTRTQLLHICYDILTSSMDRLSYQDVLKTVARIKGRLIEKHPEFYHEQFLDSIAEYVIKHSIDFERSLLIARVLSRIAHTHLGLIEYICTLAFIEPTALSCAKTNILFSFVNCLANNNFNPPQEQWDVIRDSISKNRVLDSTNPMLPWAKFCLELASLGYYDDRLLKKVFSKQFLDEWLGEDDKINYLQLLTLNEAVNAFYKGDYQLPSDVLEKAKNLYPIHALTDSLTEVLARGLGGPDYAVKNVLLRCGFVADVVACIKGGNPVAIHRDIDAPKVPIDSLKLPDGSVVVCLMNFSGGCYSMNSNRLRGTFRLILDILEHHGYVAVAINITEWLQIPAHERTPYLVREVAYKCGEIGMKLCAT